MGFKPLPTVFIYADSQTGHERVEMDCLVEVGVISSEFGDCSVFYFWLILHCFNNHFNFTEKVHQCAVTRVINNYN